jgi:hypothetical protein
MMKSTKLSIAAITIVWGSICAVSYNAKEATTELVGQPYTSYFTYCDKWAGVGGTRRCTHTGSGKETRQDTINHGPFWDYEGYKIVR